MFFCLPCSWKGRHNTANHAAAEPVTHFEYNAMQINRSRLLRTVVGAHLMTRSVTVTTWLVRNRDYYQRKSCRGTVFRMGSSRITLNSIAETTRSNAMSVRMQLLSGLR